jgi:UDP-sugar transporter A1/2/3
MLKKPAKSSIPGAEAACLWLRNIQLGAFALPLAGLTVLTHDGEQLRSYGLLHGFNGVVWLVVILNGCGGLLVAATMKYADNIVKCFAAATAIICGMLLSVPIFHLKLEPSFLAGAALTVSATVLYARKPALSWRGLGCGGRPLGCGGRPARRREDELPLCGSSGLATA